MRRISTPTRIVNKFGPGRDGFTDGDPVVGQPSTDLEAEWFDTMQEEVANVVEAADLPLDPNDNSQLLQALQVLIDERTSSVVNVPIDGAATTLITAAQASARVIVLTGAVTGNKSVVLPDVVGQWSVRHAGTGDFAVTVRTQTGAGIPLRPGDFLALRSDATNVYADAELRHSTLRAAFNGEGRLIVYRLSDGATVHEFARLNGTEPFTAMQRFNAGIRVPKGLPTTGDASTVGLAFAGDGDSGLFLVGGDDTSNSDRFALVCDNVEVAKVLRNGDIHAKGAIYAGSDSGFRFLNDPRFGIAKFGAATALIGGGPEVRVYDPNGNDWRVTLNNGVQATVRVHADGNVSFVGNDGNAYLFAFNIATKEQLQAAAGGLGGFWSHRDDPGYIHFADGTLIQYGHCLDNQWCAFPTGFNGNVYSVCISPDGAGYQQIGVQDRAWNGFKPRITGGWSGFYIAMGWS